jgi:hypothetical protein
MKRAQKRPEIGGRILGMNGEQGDGLINSSLRWKRQVFSHSVDVLIKDILELGG